MQKCSQNPLSTRRLLSTLVSGIAEHMSATDHIGVAEHMSATVH